MGIREEIWKTSWDGLKLSQIIFCGLYLLALGSFWLVPSIFPEVCIENRFLISVLASLVLAVYHYYVGNWILMIFLLIVAFALNFSEMEKEKPAEIPRTEARVYVPDINN